MVRTPGRMLDAVALGSDEVPEGVRCCFAEWELEVRFLCADVVSVAWGNGARPGAALTGQLADQGADRLVRQSAGRLADQFVEGSENRAAADVTLSLPGSVASGCVASGCVEVASKAMRVAVSSEGDISYFDSAGVLLRHELPPLRRGAVRVHRHDLRPEERIAGLGEQASPVDLRGTTHRLWNRDPGGAWGPAQDPLYCSIPVMVGLDRSGNVLAFHENTYEATVRIDGDPPSPLSPARVEISLAGGALRHYVMVGALPRLLERYSALTGRAPLPPRWALGYHQCKWGYKSDHEIRQVAEGFRRLRIPLSAIHLDIDYMDGYRVFSIDARRFPDLGSLTSELAVAGTRVVTIVDPAVKADPSYEVYAQGAKEGHFLKQRDGSPYLGVVWPGRAAFPDFTSPSTRRWWGGWYRRLLDAGVAGIWHDMNEPTSITLWGDRTLPPDIACDLDGKGGDHREAHNVYGNLMNRAGWEALAEQRPDRRPWVLSRSGAAGLQRWAWNWTGDVESSWPGLRQQVATTIGLGLSGVPYTGSDIGGFSGVPSPELYLRWLELSVFMPFCRTHSVLGSPNREPWRFDEPYRSAIGRLIRLRYRLLPYLYTLAYEASRTGHPLVRPLCWPIGPTADGRNGGPTADGGIGGMSTEGALSDDAYLLGDAMLVAPVTEAGASERVVPLPPGQWVRWRGVRPMADSTEPADRYPADDGKSDRGASDEAFAEGHTAMTGEPRIEGGRTVRLDSPAGQPVVLVRSGSIVPLDDGVPVSGVLPIGHVPGLLALHCYPNGTGMANGQCYDDAGDGFGDARVDHFRMESGGDGEATVIRWEREGRYRPPEQVRVVVHRPQGIEIVDSGPFTELVID